jgi:hypothetical protein
VGNFLNAKSREKLRKIVKDVQRIEKRVPKSLEILGKILFLCLIPREFKRLIINRRFCGLHQAKVEPVLLSLVQVDKGTQTKETYFSGNPAAERRLQG